MLQLLIVGVTGTTVYHSMQAQPLFSLGPGAPPLQMRRVRLLGRLLVTGGQLVLSDCTVEPASASTELEVDGARRRLGYSTTARALAIHGGHVVISASAFFGHPAGAICVGSAHLTLDDCVLRDNRARLGGALLVDLDACVNIVRSTFTNNSAEESGGALQVCWRATPNKTNCTAPSRSQHSHTHTVFKRSVSSQKGQWRNGAASQCDAPRAKLSNKGRRCINLPQR